MKSGDRVVDGLRFVMTCSAFPEQYDVFHGERQVGYVRVRWGNFSVECPDCGGICVIDRAVDGFEQFSDEEREQCLKEAVAKIRDWQNHDRT